MIKQRKCIIDKDCNENELCSFNDKDFNHYCVSNDKNNHYYGCLNEKNNLDYIESNSSNDKSNYNNCLEFTRRQRTPQELSYNFMVFKPKREVFVDVTNINIYLKCDSEILAVLPYNDYFTIKCDDKQENCILTSKDILMNFIVQNTKNCTKKIFLEVDYECENEKLKKILNIPINLNDNTPINIDLKCPIDQHNAKFKSNCSATFIEDTDTENQMVKSFIDKDRPFIDCPNPLFKIPRIVTDTNIYKKANDDQKKGEVKKYDLEINSKLNDLKKLKAKKYVILKKIHNNEDIDIESAYQIIDKIPIEKIVNNDQEYWKLYENYDAAQYLYNDNNTGKEVLTYWGKVYSKEEATSISTENSQSFFVWYHNSYELDNFASKLYFINIYNVSSELFDKANWGKHDNVTTGILKFENFDGASSVASYTPDAHEKDFAKMITTAWQNTVLMQAQYEKLLENILPGSNYNVSQNVITNLDNKITTYSQAIQMNNYETKINDNILIGVGVTLGIMLAVFIAVLVYYNRITAGKIKLFGGPPQ